MKKPRIWLLLVVALILPFKGAMAAAGMFCHLGSSQPTSVIVQPREHHAAAHEDHAQHRSFDVNSQSGQDEDVRLIPASSCAICSAVCFAPPLPAAGILFHTPAPLGAERFPALAPPRPSAVSSGLERPPRTI